MHMRHFDSPATFPGQPCVYRGKVPEGWIRGCADLSLGLQQGKIALIRKACLAITQPEMRSITAPQPESFSSSRSKPRSRW